MKRVYIIALILVLPLLVQSQVKTYQEDYLRDGFENRFLDQEPDYEGEVRSTLIRKRSQIESTKAILYIHGFNDYFFQTEYANELISNGFHFYAVDLRKYGRSKLEHQKWFNVRNLAEYDADIDSALAEMKRDGMETILLNGHSTGGLIVSYYAARHQTNPIFDGLILNSPFFDFNLNWIMESLAVPIVSKLGTYYPDEILAGEVSTLYGESLHKSKNGEWEYNLEWKPIITAPVNYGWIHAIDEAQIAIQNGIEIKQPVLVLVSDKSLYESEWSNRLYTGDAVLDIEDILLYSNAIKGEVQVTTLTNAMHDVVLSKKVVREKAYSVILDWLQKF